jgi:2-polyprenyl-3-methyl-5-hydroxy-6-metoxy-1,4-benzoquinol methylase
VSDTARPDPNEVGAFAYRVWNFKQGEVVSMMIHLGDRLGLYRALEGAGPVSAADLAARTGLQERWLHEWLRGQAAAGLLDYHDCRDTKVDDRFELTAVGREVLANETDSLAFAAGAFGEPTSPDVVERLADAFRTGVGLSYQDLGPSAAHRTERMLGPWARLALVPSILPALDGVCAKLERGALVADIGCGSGVALLAMAEAYPNSTFHGFDPTQHATARATQAREEKGLRNVEIFTQGGEELPHEPGYDFVITFDCIHDMPYPKRVIRAIREGIKDDGTWLIKDIRSAGDMRENFKNPLLSMMYGFSVSACMSSALSEPDGAGLGTLGFNPDVAREMTAECGFSRFEEHDFNDPANLYYEVRP